MPRNILSLVGLQRKLRNRDEAPADPSASESSTVTFHQFPGLSQELQDLVWEATIDQSPTSVHILTLLPDGEEADEDRKRRFGIFPTGPLAIREDQGGRYRWTVLLMNEYSHAVINRHTRAIVGDAIAAVLGSVQYRIVHNASRISGRMASAAAFLTQPLRDWSTLLSERVSLYGLSHFYKHGLSVRLDESNSVRHACSAGSRAFDRVVQAAEKKSAIAGRRQSEWVDLGLGGADGQKVQINLGKDVVYIQIPVMPSERGHVASFAVPYRFFPANGAQGGFFSAAFPQFMTAKKICFGIPTANYDLENSYFQLDGLYPFYQSSQWQHGLFDFDHNLDRREFVHSCLHHLLLQVAQEDKCGIRNHFPSLEELFFLDTSIQPKRTDCQWLDPSAEVFRATDGFSYVEVKRGTELHWIHKRWGTGDRLREFLDIYLYSQDPFSVTFDSLFWPSDWQTNPDFNPANSAVLQFSTEYTLTTKEAMDADARRMTPEELANHPISYIREAMERQEEAKPAVIKLLARVETKLVERARAAR